MVFGYTWDDFTEDTGDAWEATKDFFTLEGGTAGESRGTKTAEEVQEERDQIAVDERTEMEKISDPVYTGDAGEWEFMGGQDTPWGRDFYSGVYGHGADAAGNRRGPEAGRAQIESSALRQQQLQSLAALQQRSQGLGPQSAAETAALQEARANQLAAQGMGISARGATGSSGLRAASEQVGAAGIQGLQQQQLIRTQEQLAAQGQAAGLSNQMRQQDITDASTQAALDQQRLMANQAARGQQMGLNDQLIQFYLNMGKSLEEATLKANIEYQQMLADQAATQGNAATGIITSEIDASSKESAAKIGAASTVIKGTADAFGGSE